MNINTLNTQPLTSKTGNLAIALYPNSLVNEEGKKILYYARVINRSRMTMEDIADDLVSNGMAESKHDIVNTWKLIGNAVMCRLAEGMSVDTCLGLLRPSVSGTFDTASSEFDRSKHSLTVHYRPSKQITDIMNDLTPVIAQGNRIMPEIISVNDKTIMADENADETSCVMKAGGFFFITGKNILVRGEENSERGGSSSDSSIGLFFENTEDESKSVRLAPSQIYHNTSSLLEGIVPELEAGTYKIRVATRFSGSSGTRKTIRENTFEKLITIV